MKPELKRASKFLSLLLRHQPDLIGLDLDSEGWADVKSLVEKTQHTDCPLDEALIEEVVKTNDKQRFTLDTENGRIRANQGHSIEADLNLKKRVPPDTLYHGTALRFVDSIFEKGLLKQERHHVHLSADVMIAKKVGGRHGKPVVLAVNSIQMHVDGICFYQSDNGVWLTDFVDAKYLEIA